MNLSAILKEGSLIKGKPLLGVIAGRGLLPVLLAERARVSGHELVGFGIRGETDEKLRAYTKTLHLLEWNHLGRFWDLVKAEKVRRMVIVGGLPKKDIYNGSIRLDDKSSQFLKGIRFKGDDQILRALSFRLFLQGVRVIDSVHFLKEDLAPKGILTHRPLLPEEKKDVEFGFKMAKSIGKLDIGQTVLVKNRTVVAIEAMEGTDLALERAGKLSGQGFVMVKVAKPNQDLRFDRPVIGWETVNHAARNGCSVIAVEAHKTLILNQAQTLKRADELSISVVGI